MMLSEIETNLHRKGTEKFIMSDPTIITLTSSSESWVGGSKTFNEDLDRPAQYFKIIWSGSQDGIVMTSEGKTRRFDFIIVGMYDAQIAIGDHWRVDNQYFQIEWVAPYNGYEVKAGGSSHGSKPTG